MTEELSNEVLRGEVVTLQADKPFEVEFNGPTAADCTLVMVHGFGVRRDSRGLFTDIEENLADGMLSVRGDFSDVASDHTDAIPLSGQVARLKALLQYSQERFGTKQLTLLGHSQGAITIAMLQPTGSNIVLLAPPVESPFERFIKTPGWSRPGSILDIDSQSQLARSDGSTTNVSSSFWQEFKGVNAVDLYSQLAMANNVSIVFAGADQVLGNQQSPVGITTQFIENADHDFAGSARDILVDVLRPYLGSSPVS